MLDMVARVAMAGTIWSVAGFCVVATYALSMWEPAALPLARGFIFAEFVCVVVFGAITIWEATAMTLRRR